MSDKVYIPRPEDTSDVVLPEGITAMTEELAEHIHNVWSRRRLDEEWHYGEIRDDVRKIHPCLKPYSFLSDEEKSYDRETALATLRLITKLGFDITPEQQKRKR